MATSDAHVNGLAVVSLAYLVSSLTGAVNIGFIYHESYNASMVLSTTLPFIAANDASSVVGIVEIRLADGDSVAIMHEVCEEVQNNTVGFVVVSPCRLLTLLEVAVGRLDVPVLGVHTDPCHHRVTVPSSFRVQPPSEYRHNAITSLVLAEGFVQVAILTDVSEAQVTHFRSLLSGVFVESSVTYMFGGYNARTATALLSRVTEKGDTPTCLILMLGEQSLKEVSRLLSTTEDDFEDIIAIVVPSSAVSSTHGLEGFAEFHDVLYISAARPNFPSDVKCLNTTDAHVADSFMALSTAINVNVATADNVTTKRCGDSYIGVSSVAQRVTHSLRQAAPFVMKLPNNTGWEGFCVDILDELAARLNFRYELIQSPDEFWGTVDEDGNWNGVVEMTRKRSVHLGIGPITLTSERERVIDFTKPYMEEGTGIILKRFEDKSSKMFRVFKPFTESVWLSVAGAVLVVGFTLALVNHLSPVQQQQQEEEEQEEGEQQQEEQEGEGKRRRRGTSASDNIWIVYKSYMEQGSEIAPPNISGRFILGFWWVFTILMVASYKANLVAFLTVNFVGKPIRNIGDLADQTAVKPLVKQGSSLYQELQKGETETFRKLWAMVKTAPSVKNNDEALDLVLTGDYALLTDQSQIEFLRMTDCENLISGETLSSVVDLGFIVPESSPLLEILSLNLIQLQEAGLTEKWRRKWWSSSATCPTSSQASTVQSLELESTSGPFLVFAGSTTLSLLCLGVMCVYFRVVGRGRVCCKSDRSEGTPETEASSSSEKNTTVTF
ncbi:glutamate receptor ionotropic, delta-2-like isoform X2 [Haliotis rufescens]|uniref:glutamate receptor ionotropic, delta-2-like isoform X2 n=1 Tax=Haliotis rufescens TaxID=6454 RepID=UPI00201F1522|nr:glutamate receptor ionotropic, delta-2-like isoform X2 [Haliotis rufescens]